MIRKTISIAIITLMLAGTFPLATGTGTCTPASDHTAISAGDQLYLRVRDAPGKVVELWQETNDLPGLQYAPGMACGKAADHLIIAQCISTICLTIG